MDFQFRIKYGTLKKFIDITDIALQGIKNNTIFIPCNDLRRAHLFTDPLVGVLKYIILINKVSGDMIVFEDSVNIFIQNNNFYTDINCPDSIKELYPCIFKVDDLKKLQKSLKLEFGTFDDEFPEQLMAFNFLKGNEKVLEIGANIGRNTLIISSMLNDSSNLVTLECDDNTCNQLLYNKNINNFNFHIERSALSKNRLIQNGWNTKEINNNDEVPSNWKEISTITYENLVIKYGIDFDTLILDCEGSFFNILRDMPEILNNVNLIIMENDYWNIENKKFVDTILKNNNFYVEYQESGGWGPCFNFFYEVWKKIQ